MATRTICFPISGYPYCKEQPVTFTWIKGSKRQNIRAVHAAVHTTDPDVSILEVSSASVQPEGEDVYKRQTHANGSIIYNATLELVTMW